MKNATESEIILENGGEVLVVVVKIASPRIEIHSSKELCTG